ncbi:AraC-type DNA-binding protein [Paenibacillus sp. UNC496MF]|uniref:helix-turn-helix transcriptional regulator n=1 Tax=Paenibacillus sp. UNC496MF TaxID=1502753 RepID=UPI0008EFDBB8|nr:AraC family transcriptional regulator [Paenibacillus sp. UNC496MF]SFI62976.1 AraC-type DNA-binding protein [Paenibacillus sp. UNC496MF]
MSLRVQMDERYLRVEHVTTDLQRARTGTLTNRHRHPVFHFMYVTEGEGSFLVNDRITKAEPGLLYIIQPGEWHQFHGDPERPLHNAECTFLLRDEADNAVRADFFDWLERRRGVRVPAAMREHPIAVPARLRPFLLEGFARLLDPEHRFSTPDRKSLLVADLMLRAEEVVCRLIAADAVPGRPGNAEEIDALKRHLSARIAEPVRLEELAELVHWTPNYLCRVFKAHTGLSPLSYLLRLRMTEAEKLLLYTDHPVAAIAGMLGYDDPSYFARLFRKHSGRAPGAYRRG